MRSRIFTNIKTQSLIKASRGVALVETLVAILIFSIGVLGLVGLQASMMRAQGAGKFRADAANLASEVIGLMWADTPNIANYATGQCAGYRPCNDWKNKAAQLLPQGAIAVTTDTGTGDVTVTMTWTIPNEGTHSYATTTNVRID
jgi:type IV pilus assembly protein PilV